MACIMRVCIICRKQLISCKHYLSLKCTSVKTTSKITHLDPGELRSKNVCDNCHRKAMQVRCAVQLTEELQRSFEATSTSRKPTTSTDSSTKCQPKKRIAEASPGTPSTKVRVYYCRLGYIIKIKFGPIGPAEN